jgi:hypothetical protein
VSAPRSPGNGPALDALVAEAREHLDVEGVDWARLESRVMASVEEARPALVRDGAGSAGSLRAAAALLAAAAAIALFARSDPGAPIGSAPKAAAVDAAAASSLREAVGAGDVRVGGLVAAPGYVLRPGDAIEVDCVRGVFERARKVSWLLEADGAGPARAAVKSAGDALVLALEHGAIEAQVVPVPTGEAFAVDVATERTLVRVAVHGTHLRVTRAGDRVVVDLTEGVVSIGVPPRTGVTYGTTVTAPAHVELDATDLATLRIDHAPASVRAAIPLAPAAEPARGEARVAAPADPPAVSVAAPSAAAHEAHAAVPARVEPPKPAASPREAIAAAVRDCAARRSLAGEVHVTVASTLHLTVSASGNVELAQFSPPLSPDVQACAAQAIYRAKLDEPGRVSIPIEFSY